MKILRTISLSSLISFCLMAHAQTIAILNQSHDSTVRIESTSGNSSGTGFIIGDQYILTCFHVVGSVARQAGNVNGAVFPDLQITLPSGETIGGKVISTPTNEDAGPLTYDFAFIRLDHQSTKPVVKIELATEKDQPNLGDDVVFSGFPLNTPGMVTHRGMVSGSDASKSLIFIEASINKGNSGGALLNSQGQVTGIVSMREGGISRALDQLRTQIRVVEQSGNSMKLLGVNPLEATGAIINTVDQYISTGIGYARSIRFAREYLTRHPDLLK